MARQPLDMANYKITNDWHRASPAARISASNTYHLSCIPTTRWPMERIYILLSWR